MDEPAGHEVNFGGFFGGVDFAFQIDAVVELFVLHPLALEGLLAVGAGDGLGYFHAFGLDELDFGGDLFEVFFGVGGFFLLDDGGGEWLDGLVEHEAFAIFDRTDSELPLLGEEATEALAWTRRGGLVGGLHFYQTLNKIIFPSICYHSY